ncbi:hypothetical protein Tco_0256883, partial [Tanacetum coccineum]
MQAARDRQKSYADLKRKPMEFQVGDKVILKVLPWKGVLDAPSKSRSRRFTNDFMYPTWKKCYANDHSRSLMTSIDDKLNFVEEP